MFGLPESLFKKLEKERLVPVWASAAFLWLDKLHAELTAQGWPASIVKRCIQQPASAPDFACIAKQSLTVPLGTLAALRRLLAEVDAVFIRPSVYSPNAPMLTTPSLMVQAGTSLRWISAMIAETGYVGWPTDSPRENGAGSGTEAQELWKPGVMMAARFLYYHELAHASYHDDHLGPMIKKKGIGLPHLEELPELSEEEKQEVAADLLGWSFLHLETRRASASSLAGGVFALVLVALRELGIRQAKRSWRVARRRIEQLVSFVERGTNEPDVRRAFEDGKGWAKTISDILDVAAAERGAWPSPVREVLAQCERGKAELAGQRLATWCAWGDRIALRRAVGDALHERVSKYGGDATTALRCFAPLREYLERFEPELGLANVFRLL